MGRTFYQVLLVAIAVQVGQTLQYNIGDVSASNIDGSKAMKTFSAHQVLHCPSDVMSRIPIVKNKNDKPEETRLELQNGDEYADVYWLSDENDETKEFHVGSLEPNEYLRINTFVNDRFVIRSMNDHRVILLDVIVGVHHIKLPPGLQCKGIQGEGTYRANPPGQLDDFASIRGWRNMSPCDITGYYIFPNGTERWMTDIPVGTFQPHFEITYMEHNFVFKLNDGRVATRFTIKPENIPSCPRIYNQAKVNMFINHQFNDTLTEAEIEHNAMIATANEALLKSQLRITQETVASKSMNISFSTCPVMTSSSGSI